MSTEETPMSEPTNPAPDETPDQTPEIPELTEPSESAETTETTQPFLAAESTDTTDSTDSTETTEPTAPTEPLRTSQVADDQGPDHRPGFATGRHPVNVLHLVFGIAFLGMVVTWALIESGAVETSGLRWLLPIPWVAAGAAGLLATAPRLRGSRS
jgi:cytoskeletal protein RodZ